MQNVSVPDGWFWAKLNEPTAGIRKLGYYYRDPTGGLSFHILGDLDATRESLERAHQGSFRGERTFRLAGHETLRVHAHTPPDALKSYQEEFLSSKTAMVLQLSAAEREALGLPEVPPWALTYLGHPAPRPQPAPVQPAPPSGVSLRTPGVATAATGIGVAIGCLGIVGLGVVLVGGLVFMRASSAVEEFDIPPVIAPVTPPPSVPPVAPTEELAEPSVVSVERLALTATVNTITGSSAVAAGDTCSFEVAFTTFSNSNTECHTDIVCGNNVHLYGGTESGFFLCQFSTSPARVVGEDVYTTAADQDAAMVIDTDRQVLELRDEAGGVLGAFELRATITSAR